MDIKNIYNKHYKKLFIIPIIILLIAFTILGTNYLRTGDIIAKDISLTGGITATIITDQEFPELEAQLQNEFPEADIFTRQLIEFGSDQQIGILIEGTHIDNDQLKPVLEELTGLVLEGDNYSFEFVGSSLGESFSKQMIGALIFAFLLMAVAVFITFRSFIPSIAVVFAGFSDLVITTAILSIIGVKLSTAGIAALLLLIGYSIDTDILLTTRILKRQQGTIVSRLMGAMKTGMTLTCTTLAALTVAYLVSTSLVLKEMFLIILIGLLVDIIVTYCNNAGLLIWYAKKRRGL